MTSNTPSFISPRLPLRAPQSPATITTTPTRSPTPTLSAHPPPNPPPLPHPLPTSDWRTFRAHLVATHRASLPPHPHSHPSLHTPPPHWAHLQPHIEVGALLLASPSHPWPAAFSHLRHAVLLVTDVSPHAIAGLLLNRPTQLIVAQHASVLSRVGRDFSRNLVRLGGDCSTGSLEVLHGFPPERCAGAEEIVPGLYRGGLNASRALVVEGGEAPGDFHFFVAYSKWSWQQMHSELERGMWTVAAAAPNVLLGGLRRGGEPSEMWEELAELVGGVA